MKPDSDKVAHAFSPRDPSDSCFPHDGLRPRASHGFRAHSLGANSWDIREELRLRELEEVKARAAQMEKTMRWWSDCTANWREKWSKVRAERNSAREEGRQLRIKLEMTMKELSALKKKQSLSLQKEVSDANITQDLELPTLVDMSWDNKAQFHTTSQIYESIGQYLVKRQFPTEENANSKEGVVIDPFKLNEMKTNSGCTDFLKNTGSGNCAMVPGLRLRAINLPLDEEGTKVSALLMHLNEFQQTLWKEREMRAALEKEIEQMESALFQWKRKYEELKGLKTSNGKEFDIVHGQHENEMEQISGDRKENSSSQNNNDRVIWALRSELERLQAENTLGWDNKELLETEKQGLERENRRLRVQLKEMEELLDSKNRLSETFQGPDFKTSQIELQEKNQVWCSWKHLFSDCVFPSHA